ncbi:hypothetical protein, partial [Vibrio cyclitrophicus]|uniref:hypothetical protein n=1 Tax=Vibrio cyclitrophicus TaxID=47951 RepID=UPI001A7E0D46
FFYDKINLIFIKEFLTFSDVAIFSMTKLLAMAWTFLPLSFSTSIITKELKFSNGIYLAKAYRIIFLTSVPVLFITFLFSEEVIMMTLGTYYQDSIHYLFWMCTLAMFSCVNITTNRVLASRVESGKKFLIRKSVILSLVSIIFGYLLVKEYGIYGALINASIIMFIELFVLNIHYDSTYFRKVYTYLIKVPEQEYEHSS